MRGLMASGKTTLSLALGERLGWPVVDKDDINDVLINRVRKSGPLAYEAMFGIALNLSKQGFSVICDSPLTGPEGYGHAAIISSTTGAKVRLIDCHCFDDAVWRRRIETRERRPAQRVKRWSTFLLYRRRSKKQMFLATDYPTLQVDTVLPLEQNLRHILTWLQEVER